MFVQVIKFFVRSKYMSSTELLCQLTDMIKRFSSHLIRCIIQHYLRDILLEDVSVQVDGISIFTVENVVVDLRHITDLPFAVSNCQVEKLTFHIRSLYDIHVQITGLILKLNVCNLPKSTGDDTMMNIILQPIINVQPDNVVDTDEDDSYFDDFFADELVTESLNLLQDIVSDVWRGVTCDFFETRIIFVTELGVSEETKEQDMTLTVDNIKVLQWSDISITGLRFCVCPPQKTAYIPELSIRVQDRGGIVLVDCTNESPANVWMCGDSYFILSFFSQLFLENQRYLSKKHNPTPQPLSSSSDVAKKITESLSDNISSLISEIKFDTNATKGTSWLQLVKITNLNFTLDLHKGSDFQSTRLETDKVSARVFNANLWCDFVKDEISLDIEQIQTTIGYVPDPINMFMKNVHGVYWDIDLTVPEIYIRTSQSIVDSLLVILNFNIVWNEYDLLYNNEAIRFRNVSVNETLLRITYYNSPIDYKKLLRGNWKYLLKLVPPCDLSVNLPRVLMQYHVGWEEVIEEYMKEIVSTQKIRCVKKVIVGVTKRKMRKLFSI